MDLFSLLKKELQKKPEKRPESPPTQQKPEFEEEFKVCPYCKIDLSARKTPTRRSKFKCSGCSKKVYSEPHQVIYPSPYLTETQATYVDYLWRLNHWIFTMGSNEDYLRMKSELAERFGCNPDVGDILWGLMNESMIKTCEDKWERKMLKDFMRDFKNFEKRLKEKRK